MALYEHVFLARQDLAQAQVDQLAEMATKAAALAAASSAPMPTDWLPCPGKMKARIFLSFFRLGRLPKRIMATCQAGGGASLLSEHF